MVVNQQIKRSFRSNFLMKQITFLLAFYSISITSTSSTAGTRMTAEKFSAVPIQRKVCEPANKISHIPVPVPFLNTYHQVIKTRDPPYYGFSDNKTPKGKIAKLY